MATARTSGRSSARRLHVLRGAALVLAGALGIVLAPAPAQAAPATAADAAALVAARAHDLEALTEKFNAAKEQLATDQAAADAAAATVAQAQAALATAQAQVRGIARSAFTGSGLNSFQALLTSSSADEFVSRVSTLELVAGHQNRVLGQAAAAGQAAAQAQATAQQAAADAKARFDTVAAQQKKLQDQIAEYQAQFNALSAQEQRAAISGGQDRASRSDRTAPVAPVGPVVASSEAARIAVTTALAQRGKPYVWAAAGPNSFDCSGLVQFAYAAAGIALPHSSSMQARMGRAVSRSELQPGDLIAYYSPVSHIGIYIGNGQIVHAPTAGDVVRVANMDSMGSPTAMRRLVG